MRKFNILLFTSLCYYLTSGIELTLDDPCDPSNDLCDKSHRLICPSQSENEKLEGPSKCGCNTLKNGIQMEESDIRWHEKLLTCLYRSYEEDCEFRYRIPPLLDEDVQEQVQDTCESEMGLKCSQISYKNYSGDGICLCEFPSAFTWSESRSKCLAKNGRECLGANRQPDDNVCASNYCSPSNLLCECQNGTRWSEVKGLCIRSLVDTLCSNDNDCEQYIIPLKANEKQLRCNQEKICDCSEGYIYNVGLCKKFGVVGEECDTREDHCLKLTSDFSCVPFDPSGINTKGICACKAKTGFHAAWFPEEGICKKSCKFGSECESNICIIEENNPGVCYEETYVFTSFSTKLKLDKLVLESFILCLLLLVFSNLI